MRDGSMEEISIRGGVYGIDIQKRGKYRIDIHERGEYRIYIHERGSIE